MLVLTRISIFLFQILLFGGRFEVVAQDCVALQTQLNECKEELKVVDGRRQIPLSLINGNDKIEMKLLSDGFSITELYLFETGEKWMPQTLAVGHDVTNQLPICLNKRTASHKQQIAKAIDKVLKFYTSHEDVVLTQASDLVGLSLLKGVDDKYGKQFQSTYNVSAWLSETCDQADPKSKEFCVKSTNIWKQPEGNHWKSRDVLDSMRTSTSSVAEIGNEKEHGWSILNGHCQRLLFNKCQVPRVCERTLYDPVPRSQYYLAHQIIQRVFTEQLDCPDAKRFLSEEVNNQLCSKMYQEVQLISKMGYPHILRDVFVKHIAFCGYLRYPNFFRQDWIENMLSWQSESEYGCFVNDKGYQQKFWTSDTPISRRSTAEEKQEGLVPSEECFPQYTVSALSALAMSWNYMEENCNLG